MTGAERVAVTVVAPSRAIWGSERSILNLAPHLAEAGVELTLAAPLDGEFADAARRAGIALERFDYVWSAGDLGGEARAVPHNTAAIARLIGTADLVHSNALPLHPSVALAGRLRRRPSVLELHDIVAPGGPAALLSVTAALANAVVSISGATEASVRGPGRRRVHRVPQGVDLDRFTPGAPDPALRASVGGASTVVGIVGRVDPTKGVTTLVRAVAAAGTDIGLVVIGAPSVDAGDYLAQVRQLGEQLLGRRFCYAGPTTDVPGVLRSLDVLVNASDAEPFGLSILEAQACGVPVIGTAAGGIPDFVDDGRTGLLVPPRDVDALSSALARLVGDAELRARLADDALTTVRRRYGIATRAATLAALYRSLVRRPHH